jgi:hypothetical protein
VTLGSASVLSPGLLVTGVVYVIKSRSASRDPPNQDPRETLVRTGQQRRRGATSFTGNLATSSDKAGTAPGVLVAFPPERDSCRCARCFSEMRTLFLGEPSGSLILPTLDNLLERLSRIEERLA